MSPSITDTYPMKRLRLLHNSVAMVHVTNRTHLARRRLIIYPMITVRTPGALSKATGHHAIIYRIYYRGGGVDCLLDTPARELYPPIIVTTQHKSGCTSS